MASSFTGFQRSEPPAGKPEARGESSTHVGNSGHMAPGQDQKPRATMWGWVLVGGLSCVSLFFTLWTLHFTRDLDGSAYSDDSRYSFHIGGSSGVVFTPRNLIDLEVYRAGARAIVQHNALHDSTFSTSEHSLPFTYPPFAACVMVGLLVLPTVVGIVFHSVLSLGALLLTTTILTRGWQSKWRYLTAAAVVVSEPARATLSFGQINSVLLLMVVVDWWILSESPSGSRRRAVAGVLTGCATAIKLTPAVFILVPLLRRDVWSTARCAVSAMVATGLGALIAPYDTWDYFRHVLWATDRIGDPTIISNQSVKGALGRLDSSVADSHAAVVASQPTALAWALIVLALAAFLITRNCRHHNDLQSPGQINTGHAILPSVVGLFGLLASPVSWTHHWVWALPAIVTLFTITVNSNLATTTRPGTVDSFHKHPRFEPRRATWYALLGGTGSGFFLMGTVWWTPRLSRWLDALRPEFFAQTLSQHEFIDNVMGALFSSFIECLENSYVVWAGFAFVTLASVAWSPAQRRRRNTRTCQLHR
ncbi:glycosyltransferase 87 family protein [uncultured Corynebacterium sp.]|uniref:glycosyltransferase 87 family protein n=1 Tax=uncultured Corynebacterium sp. TaxID=159447 RepID=UPI0025D74F4D|nr:glycosyltransferase 87 family protein [uncultured Corynebacterium sp.]